MWACGAVAAPVLFLVPHLVQGSRVSTDLGDHAGVSKIYRSAEVRSRCPLRIVGGFAFADAPQGERACCPAGDDFFTCGYRALQADDVVQLAAKYKNAEDEPPHDVPLVVTETKPEQDRFPLITVKLQEPADKQHLSKVAQSKEEWQFRQDALGLRLSGHPWPEAYTCNCDICSQIKGTSDITSYEVVKPNWLWPNEYAVMADIIPKGLNPDYAFPPEHRYVLYLYPAPREHDSRLAARNLAFNPVLCERIACWQSRGFKVVVKYVTSRFSAKEFLKKFHARTIHAAILGATGYSRWLTEGHSNIFYSEAEGNLGRFFLSEDLDPKVSLDGTVVLDTHLWDTITPSDPAAGVALGRQTFDLVARKMHGRKVRAPSVAFDIGHFEDMWHNEGPQCLADDTATFRRQGQEVQWEVTAGRPKCEDLSGEDVVQLAAEAKVCISACGQKCPAAQEALRERLGAVDQQMQQVTLALDEQQKNDRDDCSMLRERRVCTLGGIN